MAEIKCKCCHTVVPLPKRGEIGTGCQCSSVQVTWDVPTRTVEYRFVGFQMFMNYLEPLPELDKSRQSEYNEGLYNGAVAKAVTGKGFNVNPLSEQQRLAIRFATNKHSNQQDKAGQPYIMHPYRVALMVENLGAEYFIAGMLHDVVEDTGVTLREIETMFGKEIRDAVDGVSRRVLATIEPETAVQIQDYDHVTGKEHYFAYIRRAAANPISRQIKIADLLDNTSPERMAPLNPTEARDISKRYGKAMQLLTGKTLDEIRAN